MVQWDTVVHCSVQWGKVEVSRTVQCWSVEIYDRIQRMSVKGTIDIRQCQSVFVNINGY